MRLLIVCFVIFLVGCATPAYTYRSYLGDPLSPDKVVVLDTSGDFYVGSIDGKAIPPQSKRITKIELIPGKHTITVYATAGYSFSTLQDCGAYTTITNWKLLESMGGQSIQLDGQAGHTYKLSGIQHMTYVKPLIKDTTK